MADGPITKENLLTALASMQSRKSKRKNAAWYVAKLKNHKVSFQITANVEKEIRHAGRYLGNKGLDDLVAAVKSNRVEAQSMTDNQPKEPASINQTMTNSPGAIQAGRDVNIQLQPGPRQLTPEQFNVITQALRAYGVGSVEVFEIGDLEATAFAQQFLIAIHASGWRITRSRAEQMLPIPYGLILSVVSGEAPEGIALRNALVKAGLQVQVRVQPNLNQSQLLIGIRP